MSENNQKINFKNEFNKLFEQYENIINETTNIKNDFNINLKYTYNDIRLYCWLTNCNYIMLNLIKMHENGECNKVKSLSILK